MLTLPLDAVLKIWAAIAFMGVCIIAAFIILTLAGMAIIRRIMGNSPKPPNRRRNF